MTLGWFWCFGWYHISQRAAGSGPLGLLDTFDPGKFLPSLWPHLLLCCLYLFLPSSWDCQAGPRVVNPFHLYVWPWKIHRSPFFFKSGIQRIPRRWGGLLWVPDPGSSKLPGHFMLNNSLLAHKSCLTCLLSGLFLPCLSDQNNPRDKQGFFYHYHQ